MLFLDPNKPIATCVSESCDGCEVQDSLQCHFKLKDLTHFLLSVLPSFLLGGWGIYNLAPWLLAPWILAIVGYFGFLEIRVMCSHCPHYAEPGKSLKCWANYGSPKIWRYRPGPMSLIEKTFFWAGFVVVWGFPFVCLVLGTDWFLLFVYAVSTAAFSTTVKMFLCSHCMNFACPLNTVDSDVRQVFFKRNPSVAAEWDTDVKD